MLILLRLISLRHLRGAPLRSLLTVLGVGVGVATLVGVTAINRSVLDAFRSTVDTIAGKSDLTVTASLSGFDESLVDLVRSVPGVTHVAPGTADFAPVKSAPGETLYVIGLDILGDRYFLNFEGADRDMGTLADDLAFLNSTDRLLLSERFARDHHLTVGSTLELVTPHGVQPFIVHGLLKESGPVKAFGGAVAIMFLPSAQEAFGRGHSIDRVDVAVGDKARIDAVKDAIAGTVGPQYEVERPSRRGGTVEKMVRSFQMGLNLGSGVALMVGVFLVYNTIAIGVVQRRREIGTLRALGGSRKQVRAVFTLEALAMGAVGTVLGLPLGWVVARGAISAVSRTISSIYVQVNARDVHVTGWELGLGVALGLLGSAFAALRPAVVASRVPPVEALRRDVAAGAELVGLRSWPVVVGVALLVATYPLTRIPPPAENLPLGGYLGVFAVMMAMTLISPLLLRALQPVWRAPGELAFGISGRLAADNFGRAPARTAVPAAALAIGVAMAVCIGGFVRSFQVASDRWIDQSVPADLFITSSARLGGVQNRSMDPDLATELSKLPGVRAVDKVRAVQHDLLGLRVQLISLTPEIYELRGRPLVLEGHLPNNDERGAGKVSISQNLSGRRNLHAGDTFQMSTPTGLRTYTVGAVLVDYTSDQGTVFLDRDLYSAQFADNRVDTFELYLADKSQLESLRHTITERFGEKYNLFVLTNADLRAEARHLVESAFSVTYAMEAVAVLLALLGVINTLLAAVLDRTREIGLLRAVGASRLQILRLFVAEALFIGASGGLIGVTAGTVMGLITTKVIGGESTGWTFEYVFPWALALQVFASAALCAVLAGLYPARRAARLDVVEALAYE